MAKKAHSNPIDWKDVAEYQDKVQTVSSKVEVAVLCVAVPLLVLGVVAFLIRGKA